MDNTSTQTSEAAEKVSVDQFLFSCFEHDRADKLWPQNTDARWPMVASSISAEQRQQLVQKSLDELLQELAAWYQAKAPQLTGSQDLDFDILPDVVQAFMQLISDLDQLVYIKTGEYLPVYETDTATTEPWLNIEKMLQQSFAHYASIFQKFLHWSHAAQPVNVQDLSSRPPVGRFAPLPPRRSGSHGGARRSNQGPRDKSSHERSHNQKRPGQERDHHNKTRSGGGRNKPQSSGGGRPKVDLKQERESLKEVLLAIQNLNQNSELKEMQLKPANSYYRRLQHQQIKDEGMFSRSEGEGQERCVVVMRTAGSQTE